MRETPERPEALNAGKVKLTGGDTNKIISSVAELIDNKNIYDEMIKKSNPCGDGKASVRIREYLESYFTHTNG